MLIIFCIFVYLVVAVLTNAAIRCGELLDTYHYEYDEFLLLSTIGWPIFWVICIGKALVKSLGLLGELLAEKFCPKKKD